MKYFSRIHPALFLIACITYSYLFAMRIASPGEILRPTLFALGFVLLLAYPFYWMLRDWNLAAMLLLASNTKSMRVGFETGAFCALSLPISRIKTNM